MMRAVAIFLLLAVASAWAPSQPLSRFAVTKFRQGVERLSPLALSTADFKNGMTLDVDGTPWVITEFLHVKPGKGSAFVRTKMKNLINGNSNEKTWRAGESVEAAQVVTSDAQYIYEEDDNYVFMDSESFEEIRASKKTCKEQSKYFKEGMALSLVTFNENVINIKLPKSMTLKVVECEPGIKGNTAQGVSKPATLETGAVVTVPGFIAEGEMIDVNTETNEYQGRAK
mmetsp:Transcript_9500/g.16156  ORF Transcript_9500/g.16156 Transcript_9500/m.16156 type:complete len:228 (-) Transcript_9500:94-777(-)